MGFGFAQLTDTSHSVGRPDPYNLCHTIETVATVLASQERPDTKVLEMILDAWDALISQEITPGNVREDERYRAEERVVCGASVPSTWERVTLKRSLPQMYAKQLFTNYSPTVKSLHIQTVKHSRCVPLAILRGADAVYASQNYDCVDHGPPFSINGTEWPRESTELLSRYSKLDLSSPSGALLIPLYQQHGHASTVNGPL